MLGGVRDHPSRLVRVGGSARQGDGSTVRDPVLKGRKGDVARLPFGDLDGIHQLGKHGQSSVGRTSNTERGSSALSQNGQRTFSIVQQDHSVVEWARGPDCRVSSKEDRAVGQGSPPVY